MASVALDCCYLQVVPGDRQNTSGARSLCHRSGVNRFGSGGPSGFPARRREGGSSMDDVVNRFARELADAIAGAVAENPQVEACREKARAAGFEMKVTLEAVVGFVSRSQTAALAKIAAPARTAQPRRSFEVT